MDTHRRLICIKLLIGFRISCLPLARYVASYSRSDIDQELLLELCLLGLGPPLLCLLHALLLQILVQDPIRYLNLIVSYESNLLNSQRHQ